MAFRPGVLVRLTPENITRQIDLSGLSAEETYTVARVSLHHGTEFEHWPNCPNPLDCCCLRVPDIEVIALVGQDPNTWYPACCFEPQ